MKTITALISTLLISINMFGQWEECNFPQTEPLVSEMLMHNSELYAAADSGIYKSVDDGLNWTRIYNNINDSINLIISDGTNLFGGGDGLYKSTDNGETWTQGLVTNSYVLFLLQENNEILAGTMFDYAFKSVNSGASWTQITTMPGGYTGLHSLLKLEDNIYMGSIAGKIYKTYDNMATWTWIVSMKEVNNNKMPRFTGFSRFIKTDDGKIFFYRCRGDHTDKEFLYYSTDNGESFSDIYNLGQGLAEHNGRLYILQNNEDTKVDVYASEDLGSTWYFVSQIDDVSINENPFIQMIYIYNEYMFVIYDNKMFRAPLSALATDELALKDLKFSCFPNPADDIINIKYNISQKSTVKLSVFNQLGQEVLIVVNNTIQKGKYNYNLNIDNLPKGVYNCKLQIDNNVFTKKIIKI